MAPTAPSRLRGAALAAALLAAGGAAAQDCLAPPYDAPGTDAARRLARIVADLAPVLAELPSLDPSGFRDPPQICLGAGTAGPQGSFDPMQNRIVVKALQPDGLLAGVLLHELRHAEQYQRGFCPSNDLSMQANAQATMAMEADASAVSLLAAWLLRDMGRPEPWQALAGWSMQADIAARFAEEIGAGGDAAAALTAAFTQWYASETRVERYYVASCSDYLDRQDKSHALPSYSQLSAGFYTDLCVLRELEGYACDPAATARD